MLEVGIETYKVQTFIGVYDGEQQLPNQLEIQVRLYIDISNPDLDSLLKYDYTSIKACIDDCLKQPQHTYLEGLALDIRKQLARTFHNLQRARIEVKKLNPPMEGQVGAAFVVLDY
jgi:dihydroneopterin aldolase